MIHEAWGYLVLLAMVGTMCACAPGGAEGLENGSFTAELNGFQIHYEVHGQGPVLMTVPNSWGLSLEGLRGLYEPLEERLTMVYFDPRGMGESDPIREEADMGLAAVRADFDALRRHLGLEQVNAIGWSNGAGNLIFLAEEYPEALSSAIFVHGVASFTPEDMQKWSEGHPELIQKWTAFQAETADEAMPEEEKTALQKALWLEEFFPASSADPEAAPEMLNEIFGEADFSWAHADYANREMPEFDARDKLPGIQVHSLVLAGAHDMSPPEKVRELHDGLPDSQMAVFEHSGHFAPAEEPSAFQRIVYGFLGVQ